MSADMLKPAPELLPPRDRRQSKRYFTKRNAIRVVGGALLLLIVISLYVEFRPRRKDSFGRLYESRTKEVAVVPGRRIAEPILEGKIGDQTASDPMLLEGARSERYLGVDGPPPPVATQLPPPTTTASSSVGYAARKPLLEKKGRIKISGGAEGVTVEVQKP